MRGLAPLWVPVRRVTGHLSVAGRRELLDRAGHAGAFVDGDWDRDPAFVDWRGDVRTRRDFKSCWLHWRLGVPWADTDVYRAYLATIAPGNPEFPSVEALDERYARLDEMYDEIRREGALRSNRRDRIPVSIDRNGEILWGPNGRHRLFAAICAEIECVPVKLAFVHPLGWGRLLSPRSEGGVAPSAPLGVAARIEGASVTALASFSEPTHLAHP